MNDTYNLYGKKSYEFALGSISATTHQLLSADQWNRLREADYDMAEKLLVEYGYPPIREGQTILESIDAKADWTVSYIRDLAPDQELIAYLLFEEDALNLKLLLKAKLTGQELPEDIFVRGDLDIDLLRICVNAEDYSLLGKAAESLLTAAAAETEAGRLSCMVDNAMFLRSFDGVKKKHSHVLVKLFKAYGLSRNRMTALRLRRLSFDPADYAYAFLPVDCTDVIDKDKGMSEQELIVDINRQYQEAQNELTFDSGVGVLAQYYFAKKHETAALRLLFARKNLTGNDEGRAAI